MATIVLPAQDCEPLRNADERKIVEVLTHRSCEQRQEIRKIYSQMYNEDFCDRIKRKCNKKVQKALLLWMLSPAERDAEIVREALKGQYSTNYKALMEITCSRSSTELLGIRQMYHSKFKKSIEEDIATETSMGNVQRLLLSLASAYRYEGPELDGETAMREASELRNAIMNMGDSKGLDEEGAYVFTRVLGTRSVAQLQATLNCYKQKYGQEISRDLEKECGGELEDAIRTCVECFYRPSRYYAQLLYEAMKGVGADDLTLIRVITTRAEVDMESIKAEFHGLYHKSLAQAIRSEQAMANPLKSFFLAVVDATRDGAVKAATKMPSQKIQNA